ncbi:MAG TPA: hypothetical protein VE465_01955 [Streptosporangiaceae bacterium]|jgi:hypothetical protein|nr:hypothetical protein [Streptosporangiaceae bacterium]
MWSSIRRAVDRGVGWLTRTGWYIQVFGDRRAAEETASLAGGWVIAGRRTLCPRCARGAGL